MAIESQSRQRGDGGELGRLLRIWRDIRGKSQIKLSLDSGISQRHLSFVESGRSAPSQELLLKLARTLDMPLGERNRLLLAAGFAPAYPDDEFDADAMSAIGKALDRVLRQHEPYPAVVLDRYWNVLRSNDASSRFFGSFVDLSLRPQPRNLLRLMFDPEGMRPFIANWKEASQSLLERVRREAVGGIVDEKSEALLTDLVAYTGTPCLHRTETRPAAPKMPSPVVPLSFICQGHTLSYFSMVTTVGTPLTVAAQEIRLECMYPLDDEAEQRHLAFMASLPPHVS